MLYTSEFVEVLENELDGFQVAWDAGLPFDSQTWLITWPKLTLEKKIKNFAHIDLIHWMKKWKGER